MSLEPPVGRAGPPSGASANGAAPEAAAPAAVPPDAAALEVAALEAADLPAVLAALPGSVLVLAPDAPRFTMLAASDARLAATHTTREATLGRGLFEVFPDANPGNPDPTGVANLRASLERVLATRAPDRMPDQRYDLRRADGTWEERYWAPRNTPVLGEGGAVRYILHEVEDVTALVRAGAACARAQRRAARTLERISEGYVALDGALRVVAVNPAAERILGRPREQLLGRAHREAFASSVDAETGRAFRRVVAERVVQHLTAHVTRDGDDLHLEIDAYPTDEGDGGGDAAAGRETAGRGVAVFFRDVTARARAAAALRASEARQAFLLELSDALRPLADPVEIQREAARVLGRHLGAGRASYAEVEADGAHFVVHRDHTDGVPSFAGRYLFDSFGAGFVAGLRAGRTVAVTDAARDARLSEAERAAYAAGAVRAAVAVPRVKGGRLAAVFFLHFPTPHEWPADEVVLVEETAERTWAAVERARAERGLLESEERLRLALRAAGMGTFVWHPAEDRGDPDARTRELFGLPPGGALNLAVVLTEMLQPDDRAGLVEALTRAQDPRGDGGVRVEVRIRRPSDREERWLAITAQSEFTGPPDDPARHAARIRGVVDDVTERRHAEAARRESEARATALVATLPGAAVFVIDRDLRYRLAAGEAFRAAGFTPEQFVGRTVGAVLGPALAAEYEPLFTRVLDGGAFEWEHAAHGRTFLSRGTPLRDAAGRATAALVVSVDVTARRATEEALRASEARYRTLVENVRDYAIFLLDADGVVTEWTAGAQRLKGYTPEQAVGQHLARFYTPEDVAAGVPAAHLAQAAAEGRGEWEGWRVRRDGTRFWATEIATAVRDGDGRLVGFSKISRDLTERRLAEQAAEQAQLQTARDALRRALAEAEETERRRLARELHDQLGQELTALRLGLDDALRLAATHLPAPHLPAPDDGARAGAAAALPARLAQLQALAQRMTAGARYLALELRPPELDDVGLESALETYVAEWGARYGVAADVAVMGLRGRRILPDVASALYRIAQETLTNVAKHAGARHVSVIVEQSDGEVRLIVEDDGRGFDLEATDARVRRERRLGLAGMRERAALVGGTVAVESSPGAGTTVYARLPVDGTPEPPADRPGEAAGETSGGAAPPGTTTDVRTDTLTGTTTGSTRRTA